MLQLILGSEPSIISTDTDFQGHTHRIDWPAQGHYDLDRALIEQRSQTYERIELVKSFILVFGALGQHYCFIALAPIIKDMTSGNCNVSIR